MASPCLAALVLVMHGVPASTGGTSRCHDAWGDSAVGARRTAVRLPAAALDRILRLRGGSSGGETGARNTTQEAREREEPAGGSAGVGAADWLTGEPHACAHVCVCMQACSGAVTVVCAFVCVRHIVCMLTCVCDTLEYTIFSCARVRTHAHQLAGAASPHSSNNGAHLKPECLCTSLP